MNNRIAYFDFLRGIAILMVVAIHTFSLNSATDSSIAVRQILNIAVPLFLAISGFFLSNKDLSSRKEYLFFLKKQIPRVYIPCFIWSLPLYFLALYLGGSIMVNTIYLLFCGFSIYYFIALIIQYYILLPVFQKMTKNIMGGGNKCVCINYIYICCNLCYAS